MTTRQILKQSIIGVVSLAVIATAPAIALAQATTPAASSTARQTARTTAQENTINRLKTKANNEIQRRLTSLNNLQTRVTNAKKLSDSDRSSLLSTIQQDVTNLTNLKAKIDGDTDLTTLRTDVQSIVKDYRVYALVFPKAGLVVAADAELSYADRLNTLAGKLQTRIQQVQQNGKNVSSLQTTLTDMQAKIADAQKQAQSVISAVMPLTPDGYPGNKTTLQAARATLKTGRTDLQAARKDASTIIAGIKGLKNGQTSTPSGTAK